MENGSLSIRHLPFRRGPLILFNCFRYDESSFIEKTSICPIPRPVSSVNMAALLSQSQSSFPVCLTPPPSPSMFQLPTSSESTTLHYPVTPPMKISGVYIQPNQMQATAVPDSPSFPVEDVEVVLPAMLKRAISCDSVCSDTSVALGDLEILNVTGYLCIGLEYDR